MASSILLFTFSPVQSFISEARRAADLYTGSQILVELAKAAGSEIQKHAEGGTLIYPAQLSDDVPNKLVAKVAFENCEQVANAARTKLLERWHELAQEARASFEKEAGLSFDSSIWERQTANDYLWETYWSAALLDGRNYEQAYQEAERGLVAAKFTRPFVQYHEEGFKDSLSGKREALHGKEQDGREYWYQVGKVEKITPIKIRPSVGDKNNKQTWRTRERLDAVGVIKRFHPIAEKGIEPFNGFPSTSSIASLDYLKKVGDKVKDYKDALSKLFGAREPLMQVRKADKYFPYDGDFLYKETLTQKRLKDDYSIPDANITTHLEIVQTSLKKLQEEFGKPSSYYAIIVFDGDNMGKHLQTLNEKGHADFSGYLRNFSNEVQSIAVEHHARVIYNGGDDVLALAPLSTAFALARELTRAFSEKTTRTASAGIALSHHLSPLGTALRAARSAESFAKELSEEKNAVCVFALKRSGEPIRVRSGWGEVEAFQTVVAHFNKDEISSHLPYDVARSSYALPDADEKFKAELHRLIKRHWLIGEDEKNASVRDKLSQTLHKWASSFPKQESPSQSEELANWLALARFIAKGGRE